MQELDYKKLGNLIGLKRLKEGKTLTEMGEILNIDRQTIKGYEIGKRIPIDKWLQIKEVLNISDYELNNLDDSIKNILETIYLSK